MESFHWDKHFITGLSDVDEQHQNLVDIINQFGSQLATNSLAPDSIEAIFKNLEEYTQYHFREEEELMAKVGIDARHLEAHIRTHNEFLQEVTLMHARISADKITTAENLFKFLSYWLAYHILGLDQNMARQIKAIESGVDASKAYENEERLSNSSTEPLLAALNGLFHEVSKRNNELLQLNMSLEEKVTARTKALSDANQLLEELSLTDVLTGLPNRRHAMRSLNSLWQEALGLNLPLSCMMIDADHFKEVNDTYGHDAGDLVLCELAKALQHSVRSDDIVCRLGGDEFLIICPNTNEEGGLYIAELTRKTVSELRVPTGGGAWHGSISVGMASRISAMQSFEDLIKGADNGVYAAKRAGKNCVRSGLN